MPKHNPSLALENSAWAKDRQDNIAAQIRYAYPFSSAVLLRKIKEVLDSPENGLGGGPTNRDIQFNPDDSWHWAVRELIELEFCIEQTPSIEFAIRRKGKVIGS